FVLWQQRCGKFSKYDSCRRMCDISFNSEVTRQHAINITVNNRNSLIVGERRNCSGSIRTDTTEFQQSGIRIRKDSAEILCNKFRCFMKISGSRIIAQALPKFQNLIFIGGSQIENRWKSIDKR